MDNTFNYESELYFLRINKDVVIPIVDFGYTYKGNEEYFVVTKVGNTWKQTKEERDDMFNALLESRMML